MLVPFFVIPAKAGIQSHLTRRESLLGSRFRGNDEGNSLMPVKLVFLGKLADLAGAPEKDVAGPLDWQGLRAALRSDAPDDRLAAALDEAMRIKPERHHFRIEQGSGLIRIASSSARARLASGASERSAARKSTFSAPPRQA